MEGLYTCVWTMLKMHMHILIAEYTSYFSWHKSEQLPVVGHCYTGQQNSRFSTWRVHVGFPKPLDGVPSAFSPPCVKATESGGQGELRLVLTDTFLTPVLHFQSHS